MSFSTDLIALANEYFGSDCVSDLHMDCIYGIITWMDQARNDSGKYGSANDFNADVFRDDFKRRYENDTLRHFQNDALELIIAAHIGGQLPVPNDDDPPGGGNCNCTCRVNSGPWVICQNRCNTGQDGNC